MHWPSIFQLALSLLAALFLLFISGLFALGGVLQLIEEGLESPAVVPSFMVTTSLLLGGGLMLPSAWYAYRRLVPPVSEPAARRRRYNPWVISLLVIIFVPLLLLVGNWAARSSLAWLLLPGISLLAAVLPIYWLVSIGARSLAGGSLQRRWGLFAGGLVFSPVLIIVLELLAIVAMILVVGVVIAINPDLARDLSTLAMRLASSPPGSDNWLNIISPYIMHPAFLAAIFAYMALLIPLIEEALKPLGLWLLAGRRLTPTEGFVGGVISGAGFALFENLSALSTGGEQWAFLASTRISTALLHMLTTGLVGWALAHAWSQRRYLRLALSYAIAVTLHGLWNALGIASFSLPQLNLPNMGQVDPDMISAVTMVGLGLLTGLNFILFLGFNQRLQPKADFQVPPAEPQPEIPPSLD